MFPTILDYGPILMHDFSRGAMLSEATLSDTLSDFSEDFFG